MLTQQDRDYGFTDQDVEELVESFEDAMVSLDDKVASEEYFSTFYEDLSHIDQDLDYRGL
ncbi:hypothetical protein NVP1121O_103 [Vibrio phage 1.121.O._10N.286.46.C4]|nr:hypothetical protein NVP1121O_103 [Vibrio phage 1.121.O._10N.286.46.C4]